MAVLPWQSACLRRTVAFVMALLVCVCLFAVSCAAAQKSYSVPQYRQLLMDGGNTLETVLRSRARRIPAGGLKSLRLLSEISRIRGLDRTGEMEPMVSDMDWLTIRLRRGDLGPAQKGLANIRFALALTAPGTQWSGAQSTRLRAEETMRRVASDRRFNPSRLEELTAAIQRAVALLLYRLSGGFDHLHRPSEWTVRFITRSVMVVVCLVLLLVLALALRRWSRLSIPAPQPQPESEPLPADPESAEQRARALLGQGEFMKSLRLAYSALLLRLDGAGAISLRPGMTGREALQQLREAPVREVMASATCGFEDCFYRRLAAGREDCERMLSVCGELERVLG